MGPTGTISPLLILGTGCVNSLALVCVFKTLKVAMDESSNAVAAKWMVEWERSRGGWTPTPLQAILNSLRKKKRINNNK